MRARRARGAQGAPAETADPRSAPRQWAAALTTEPGRDAPEPAGVAVLEKTDTGGVCRMKNPADADFERRSPKPPEVHAEVHVAPATGCKGVARNGFLMITSAWMQTSCGAPESPQLRPIRILRIRITENPESDILEIPRIWQILMRIRDRA